MSKGNTEDILAAARSGDSGAREELIKRHKDFIAGAGWATCKRFLVWGRDDELSVAQIAFNEAIDKYRPEEGASFHTFARRVIHHRLVDYIRRESKHKHISLSPMNPGDEELGRYDAATSTGQYMENEIQAAFAEMVEEYIKTLATYGIDMADLIKASPRRRNSKETLNSVAKRLLNEPELMDYLQKYKKLPLKELERITGIKRRVLEKGRKYIIALALILNNPVFSPLKEFATGDGSSLSQKL